MTPIKWHDKFLGKKLFIKSSFLLALPATSLQYWENFSYHVNMSFLEGTTMTMAKDTTMRKQYSMIYII